MFRIRTVSVIGPSAPSSQVENSAFALGRGIAERKLTLVCGGHGGVMEAACRGAHEAGGLTVGVLRTTSFDDANPYVKVAIPTGMGEARNLAVALSGDVVIAVGQSAGTLSEMAFAARHRRPLLTLHCRDLPDELLAREQPDVTSALETLDRILEQLD